MVSWVHGYSWIIAVWQHGQYSRLGYRELVQECVQESALSPYTRSKLNLLGSWCHSCCTGYIERDVQPNTTTHPDYQVTANVLKDLYVP